MTPTKSNIDGILLLDKPLTFSSNKALQKVKRLFNAQKAGHTGSLDPLATGMLPICFGEATKYCRFLLDADKAYRVTMVLGANTTTGDKEGEIIQERALPQTIDWATVLARFTGPLEQIPPMFSAIKQNGQPLYKLARQGKTVERAARLITIRELIFEENNIATEGSVTLKVVCTKGTYIRTLAEDIGEFLGCGAHVSVLHRIWLFPFENYTIVNYDALLALPSDALLDKLIPTSQALSALLPKIELNAENVFYLQRGQPVSVLDTSLTGWVTLMSQVGDFLGVGELGENGEMISRRLVRA